MSGTQNRLTWSDTIGTLFDSSLIVRHYFIGQLHDATMIGIRFHPWGFRALVNSSAFEIPKISALQDFGNKIAHLEELVTNAPSSISALKLIDQYLRGNLCNAVNDRLVADVVRVIRASGANTTVEKLSARYGITSRRLEQRFQDQIGVGPKHFLRAG